MTTPYRKFFHYASLNILGMLGISCYILADTFFTANGVGPDGLAALNLAIPIYSLVHGCALMLGTGGATKYVVAKCQGEHIRANGIFSHGIICGFLLSALFMTMGLLCSDHIARMLQADSALFDMTRTYLKVILLFSPFFIANEQLLAYVRADGNPALAMTAMIAGSVSNIILDYIFIYPLHMGIFGAALATGIAPIVSMLVLSRHFTSHKCGFRLAPCPANLRTLAELALLGVPALVTELSSGLVMIIFNLLFLKATGSIGVAAYGIIANIALVTSSVFTGLAQGIQPLVSEAHSTDNRSLLKKYIRCALCTAFILSAILYLLMYQYASPITALFNNTGDPILQSLGTSGMILYFTSLPLTAINIVLCALFTAAERPFPAQLISLLRGLIVFVPLAFFLSKHFDVSGIWITVTVTELITAAIAAYLWMKHPIYKTPAL